MRDDPGFEVTATCLTGMKSMRTQNPIHALAKAIQFEADGCVDVRIRTPDSDIMDIDTFSKVAITGKPI